MYRKLMLVLIGVAVLGLAVGLVGCPRAEPPPTDRLPVISPPVDQRPPHAGDRPADLPPPPGEETGDRPPDLPPPPGE